MDFRQVGSGFNFQVDSLLFRLVTLSRRDTFEQLARCEGLTVHRQFSSIRIIFPHESGGHNTPKGGFVLTKRLVVPPKKAGDPFSSPSRQIIQRVEG